MLDDLTKRRINSLRDILVGKLPDPKAQVEQITNGLIYKFMSDMDEESVSMGGKSTYFSGKFQKYSWKNLMDTKTSGVEKMTLYSEAIEQMYTNENLPELFREIFKNSFLPFKDPSTLNMFLKEINEFHYSHSEKLGDAFEYLLSFMGSQGDAGQFRTPRHIIDFIVEIVNPQKNETILDPACGTAGFLISSYKHILNQNTKKNLGDGLTASDRKKIGENLNGYDISPDMVKMSLVNMYLHKFTNPKINEYDTLSSEDRWNEYYDVILANPPFFSPKGGITPHNRFGVKSTKAEVLFIDYINEHLKPNGRAGIIVPEGIVFQNGVAYKNLRKNLISNSLIAVISMPAGVFQPYSGVKTSILILDKKKNKSTENIYFINVENDGYSLNSNRNKIEGGQLEFVKSEFLNNFKNKNKNIKSLTKRNLLDDENFSLLPSSYEDYSFTSKKYSSFKLKDICNIKTGKKDVNEGNPQGIYPFFTCAENNTFSDKFSFDCEALLIVGNGRWTGKVNYYKGKFEAYQRTYVLSDFKELNCKFLYYILNYKMPEYLDKLKVGNAIPFIKLPMLQDFKLPLPTLEIQNQIVEELDSYQKIIDGCRQVIENYKPSIYIEPSWKKTPLGELPIINLDSKRKPISKNNRIKGDIPYYGSTQIVDYVKDFIFNERLLLIGEDGAKWGAGENTSFIIEGKSWVNNHVHVLKIDTSKISDIFLSEIINSMDLSNYITGAVVPKLTQQSLNKILIPMPDFEIQKKFERQILEEKNTINGNKDLIDKFSNKIDKKINEIWKK
jgi:type I restriction enzyme M protein